MNDVSRGDAHGTGSGRSEEADRLYRSLVEDLDAIVWEADEKRENFSFVSRSAERILQYPVARWLSEPGFLASIVHPEDREIALSLVDHSAAAGSDHHGEYRLLTGDGRTIWVRDVIRRTGEPGTDQARCRGMMIDITKDRNYASLCSGLAATLEIIATGGELSAALTALARTMEHQIDGMLCSVLLLDDVEGCLRHGAAPSLPDSWNSLVDGFAIGPKAGSCGTAAYEGRRVVVKDIETDPLWEEIKAPALQHGLRSCWSQPIFSTDKAVLGTFAMYYREPRAPGPAELDLIEKAAHMAGIAIQSRRDQENLRQSLSLLRATLDATADGIVVHDLQGRIVTFNRAHIEMWALPDEVASSRDARQWELYVMERLVDPEEIRPVSPPLARSKPASVLLHMKDGRVIERRALPQRVGGELAGWVIRDREIKRSGS